MLMCICYYHSTFQLSEPCSACSIAKLTYNNITIKYGLQIVNHVTLCIYVHK